MKINAGVVTSMMEDAPHVGVDSTNVENIVQGFVYRPRRGDGIVVAVVRDVQQKECLRNRIQKVEADKLPRIRLERVKGNPAARQHCQPHGDFDPHGEVGLGRNVPLGKEILKAPPQDFGKRRLRGRGGNGVPERGLRWHKSINFRIQTNNRLVLDLTGAIMSVKRPNLPRHRFWRKRQDLMLARKLKQDQGNLGSLGAGRNDACSLAVSKEWRCFPNLVTINHLPAKETKTGLWLYFFNHIAITPKPVVRNLGRIERRMVLKHGWAPVFEVGPPTVRGEH
jgi:hypothetical protein